MKKVLSYILLLFIVYGFSTVYAEDMQITDFSKLIEEKQDWENENRAVVFSDDKIKSIASDEYISNKKYKNGSQLITMDIDVEDYNSGWIGIMLRTADTKTAPWLGNACILFVVKEEQIELQIYNGGSGGGYMPVVVENPINRGRKAHIAIGALKNNNGAQIVFIVDGKLIINYYSEGVPDDGYFVINCGKTNVSFSPCGEKNFIIPCNMMIDAENIAKGVLSAKFDIISFGTNDTPITEWYISDNEQNKGECVHQGSTYQLEEQALDKYVSFGIKIGENIIYSEPLFIDSAKNYIYNSVVMKKDWFIAYADGEQHQIDEDFTVAPMVFDGKLNIPVRFFAEKIGYTVLWNDEDKTIKLISENNESIITSDEYIIKKNKSYMNIEKLEEKLKIYIFFDETNGLIVADKRKFVNEQNISQRIMYYLVNGI